MKNKKKKLLSILASTVIFASSFPLLSLNAETYTKTTTGTVGDYNYELWNQYDQGTAVMNLNDDGSFDCQWNGIENVLFRTGKKFSPEIPYTDLGVVTVEYEADYNLPDQNSYLCVYGWTRNPLIEYYIVDSWGSWRPPGNTSDVQKLGEISVDGGVYDVYRSERVNQPSIDGDTTFYQYWSVRQTKRTSGTITVSDHFQEWEKLGLNMGNLYEIALNVEGYKSNGEAVIKKNIITINGESKPVEPETPVEPDENGYYFYSTFESGNDNWQSRGSSSLKSDSNVSCSGNNSLFVSGRTDKWNGASYVLDSEVFVPGNTYSFSAWAMQNTKSTDNFQLTLQYTDSSGSDKYMEIASSSAENGEWTKLENTSFKIPEDASNMLIYVEMPDSLSDFYIDDALGAKEGTENPISFVLSYKKGDVNLSGETDIKDILDLKKYLLGLPSNADATASDVSGDGNVNVIDLVMLKHIIITGENEQPPVEDEPAVTEEPPTENPVVSPYDTVNKSEPTQFGIWENNADISWIDVSKPMVAICFDDGPVGNGENDSSTRILNALESNNFHSTFFYWGNRINDNNKDEIKRAFEMGCEVANHTYTHPNLSEMTADQIRNEVNTTINILNGITGGKNFLIRPPYLAVNDNVKANTYAPLITCSMDSQDWNSATAQQMIDKIKSAMDDGSLNGQIVLMHETYATTAEAMEYLAPYMKEKGWQIVNVSEMFKAKGKDMYSGQVYTSTN